MSLQSFRLHGVNIEQAKVDITDKQTKTLVAALANHKGKIYRLVVTGKQECHFVIRTASQELRDVFIGSDLTPHIEEAQDFRWPVLAGNVNSDLQIYQSDLTSCDASVYIQYRYESV